MATEAQILATRNPQHVTRNPQHEPINQFESIMQNKPNFWKSQMNVNKVLTRDYEKKTLGEHGKNKPNTNPIQTQYEPNTNPKQSQNKPNQTQLVAAWPPASLAYLRPTRSVDQPIQANNNAQNFFAGSNLLFFSLIWPKFIPI